MNSCFFVTNKAKQEKLGFLQQCKKKNLSGVVVSGLRTDDSYYHEILSSNIPCALVDMRVAAWALMTTAKARDGGV
ncbi:MAG: hypothetical protein LBS02_05185 [Hungatella sp.]|nr:hypothetical protein [Hungatella sp.]